MRQYSDDDRSEDAPHFIIIFSLLGRVEEVEVMKRLHLLQKQLQAAQQVQRKRRVDHRKRVQWF